MIKLSANLSKKVPILGVDYSSQQYGASLEIEVSDADKPEAIKERIRELYSLLSSAINEQIGVAHPASVKALPPPTVAPVARQIPPPPPQNGYTNGRNRVAAASTNGNGNGRRVTCTEAQAKCIYAICKAQGIDMASVLADYNVADARDLHVKDASRLIDDLKSRQTAQ